MSEPREMSFTFLACADLRRIWDAIAMPDDMWGVTAADNQAQAQAFGETFTRHCGLLAANPDLGADRGDLLHGLRSSAFQKYEIFYRTRGETVEVVRASRDADPFV